MKAFLQQRINQWLSIALLSIITYWVALFYFIEKTKIIAGNLTTDYRIYLMLVPEDGK